MKVTRLASALGAEIRGVDLARVGPEQSREVERLLWEHQILFFPDQTLSVEQHVEFGARFGELEGHPHLVNPDVGHEKILELCASRGGVADEWHSDLSFLPKPAIYSILHKLAPG